MNSKKKQIAAVAIVAALSFSIALNPVTVKALESAPAAGSGVESGTDNSKDSSSAESSSDTDKNPSADKPSDETAGSSAADSSTENDQAKKADDPSGNPAAESGERKSGKAAARASSSFSEVFSESDKTTHDFGDGKGSVEAYEVYNSFQLEAIGESDETLAKNYILTQGIVCSSKSFSIGSYDGDRWSKGSHAFTGKFDGQNHCITLYMDRPDSECRGVFAYVGESALVQNLIVDGAVSRPDNGSCAGLAYVNTGTIRGCTNEAEITGSSVGGISVTCFETGTIENCINGSKSSNKKNAGKLNGKYNSGGITTNLTEGGAVKNCTNYGTITTETSQEGSATGGIIGNMSIDRYYNQYSDDNRISVIENCDNFGTIKGISQVGGIMGQYIDSTGNDSVLQGCKNAGRVEGETMVGGIVGRSDESVIESSNEKTAFVSATVSYCGGIVGKQNSLVYDCQNQGTVSGYDHTGGISGYLGKDAMTTYSFNYGLVEGARNYIGGVAGFSEAHDTTIGIKVLKHLKIKVPIEEHNITYSGNYGKVRGCGNYAAELPIPANTYGEDVGGVVGYLEKGDIFYIFNEGIVNGAAYTGGIVGYAENKKTSVRTFYTTGPVYGYKWTGGIAGHGGNLVQYGYTASPVFADPDGHYPGILEGHRDGREQTISHIYYNTDTVISTALVTPTNDIPLTTDQLDPLTTKQMLGADALSHMPMITNVDKSLNAQWISQSETSAEWDNGTTKQSYYPAFKDLINAGQPAPSLWLHQFDTDQFEPAMGLESVDDFFEFGRYYTHMNVLIRGDIAFDKSDEYTLPVNDESMPFTGKLDGVGHTITFNGTAAGLFSIIQKDDKKEQAPYAANLTLAGTIENSGKPSKLGAFAGTMYEGSVENCVNECRIQVSNHGYSIGGIIGRAGTVSFSDCENHADITTETAADVGGIAGYCEQVSGASFENCVNSGNISGIASDIGGITSYVQNGTFTSCSNSGNISGIASDIGGITSYAKNGEFISCSNNGTLYTTSRKSYNSYIGGIAGSIYIDSSEPTKIEWCSNTGAAVGTDLSSLSSSELDSPAQRAGGIIGYMHGTNENTIEFCYNTASVCGVSAGGIVGEGNISLSECANYGDISTTGTKPCFDVNGVSGSSYGKAGGIYGGVSASSGSCSIKDCFNIGQVSAANGGSPDLAGLVGRASSSADLSQYLTLHNCYNAGIIGDDNASQNAETLKNAVHLVKAQSEKQNTSGNENGDIQNLDISNCYYNTQINPHLKDDNGLGFIGNNQNSHANDSEKLHIAGYSTENMTGTNALDTDVSPTGKMHFGAGAMWKQKADETIKDFDLGDGAKLSGKIKYYPHLMNLENMNAQWPADYDYDYGPGNASQVVASQTQLYTGEPIPFTANFPGLTSDKYTVLGYHWTYDGNGAGQFTWSKDAPVNTGTYDVICKINDEHYDFRYGRGTLRINKETLKIRADDKSKLYGENDPPLTYSVEKLLGQDTLDSVLGKDNKLNLKTTGSVIKLTLTDSKGKTYSSGKTYYDLLANYDLRLYDGTLAVTKDATAGKYTISGTRGSNGHSDWYLSPVTIKPVSDSGYDTIYNGPDKSDSDILNVDKNAWQSSLTIGEKNDITEQQLNLWLRKSTTGAITSPSAKETVKICTKELTAEPVSPAKGAEHDPSDREMKLRFNQQMETGDGNFYLYKQEPAEAKQIQALDVHSRQVKISNNAKDDSAVVTLTFDENLDPSSSYYITNDSSALYTIRGLNFKSLDSNAWSFTTKASSDTVKIKDLQLVVDGEEEPRLAADTGTSTEIGGEKYDTYSTIIIPAGSSHGGLDVTPLVKGVISDPMVEITALEGKTIPTKPNDAGTVIKADNQADKEKLATHVSITGKHVSFRDDKLEYALVKVTAKGSDPSGSGNDTVLLKIVRTGWEVAEIEDGTSLNLSAPNLLSAIDPESIQIPEDCIACITLKVDALGDKDIGPIQSLLFEAAAGDKTIGTYMDINLYVDILQKNSPQSSDLTRYPITETASPLKLRFELPDGAEGNRDYGMLYRHNYHMYTLEGKVQPHKVFETESSQFSLYALTYTQLYDITARQTAGGKINVKETRAAKNDTVAVTADPDQGWRFKHLRVNGKIVEGSAFSMPAEDVTVAAIFEKIPPVDTNKDDQQAPGNGGDSNKNDGKGGNSGSGGSGATASGGADSNAADHAKGANESAHTGDSFPLISLLIVLTVCAVILCALILYGRRRKG
ncbi:Ig-like domain-containing protein [Anaerovorax odorimutans]|uniref:Ig-like domain-containing protein n=1 Tax=Anaerovorax odorimutans TaxID=109327 RepID=A0ABT1RKU6_9FIRM|nr:MBG domain-containing protein [Anaerovorax odorimutans]MCQ4635802.1 Ig-like domain-containing protein [Anaerovorax odorimutans]